MFPNILSLDTMLGFNINLCLKGYLFYFYASSVKLITQGEFLALLKWKRIFTVFHSIQRLNLSNLIFMQLCLCLEFWCNKEYEEVENISDRLCSRYCTSPELQMNSKTLSFFLRCYEKPTGTLWPMYFYLVICVLICFILSHSLSIFLLIHIIATQFLIINISNCLKITLELHLVALHHSWATGEPRDAMHLVPGALEQSRNGKQFVSIKSYCDF